MKNAWVMAGVLALTASIARGESQEAALRMLEKAAEMEQKTFAALGAFTMKYRQDTRQRGGIGGRELLSTFTVSQDGARLRVERMLDTSKADDGRVIAGVQTHKLLVTDEVVMDCVASENMTGAAHIRRGQPKDPGDASIVDFPMRLYGFGNGQETCTQLVAEVKNGTRWDLRLSAEVDNSMCRVLEFWKGGTKSFELCLDPARGHMTVQSRFFVRDGQVERENSCVPGEFEAGLWLPISWRATDYNTEVADRPVSSETRVANVEYAAHRKFAEAYFTENALEIPSGSTVQEIATDGSVRNYQK